MEPIAARGPASTLVAYAAAGTVAEPRLAVTVGVDTGRTLPALGFRIGAIPELTRAGRDRLTELRPGHIRVDLQFGAPDLELEFGAAAGLADDAACGLEIGVACPAVPETAELARLADLLAGNVAVDRVLVLGGAAALAPRATLRLVRDAIRSRAPAVEVFAASGGHFADLNRGWDDVGPADGVAFPIMAQVHAMDDLSVIESLAGQAATVETAAAKSRGLPVVASAVSLGAANPDAEPDPRQASLFGAGWTLGSIASLAGAGARAITYAGLAGPSGPIWGPDASAAGSHVMPAYHVLADLGRARCGRLRAIDVDGSLPAAALAVAGDGQLILLVANLSPRSVRVAISGLERRPLALRILDASTAVAACIEPERYRAGAVEDGAPGDHADLELGPFAIATISQVLA